MAINITHTKERVQRFSKRWINLTFIIVMGFIVSLMFFGDNNFITSSELKKQIRTCQMEIKQNEDSAAVYEAKLRELNTDPQTLERIARENHGMKRPNEDVYVTDIP